MKNKIYRNDPCPCGSGKKYKNCCYKAEPKSEQTLIRVAVNKENYPEEVADVLIKAYEFSKIRWGACHLISSVLYVVFSEMEYDTKLYIGEVAKAKSNSMCFDTVCFDHSWITVDDKIIDIAINFAYNGERTAHTVFLGKDVKTNGKPIIEYGKHHLGLNEEALRVLNTPFVTYMDLYPDSKNGAWDIVGNILNKDIDIKELHKKYENTNRIYINND